jgi:hypothetical protein
MIRGVEIRWKSCESVGLTAVPATRSVNKLGKIKPAKTGFSEKV